MRSHRDSNTIASHFLAGLINRSNNINSLVSKGNTRDEVLNSESEIENKRLLESLYNAKLEWTTALDNFQLADSKDMVDYYTYKITACQIKYNYLLKQAKEKGLNLKLITQTSTA